MISWTLKKLPKSVSTSALGVFRFVDNLKGMAKINHGELNLISRSPANEKGGCFVVFVQVSCSKTQILENGNL